MSHVFPAVLLCALLLISCAETSSIVIREPGSEKVAGRVSKIWVLSDVAVGSKTENGVDINSVISTELDFVLKHRLWNCTFPQKNLNPIMVFQSDELHPKMISIVSENWSFKYIPTADTVLTIWLSKIEWPHHTLDNTKRRKELLDVSSGKRHELKDLDQPSASFSYTSSHSVDVELRYCLYGGLDNKFYLCGQSDASSHIVGELDAEDFGGAFSKALRGIFREEPFECDYDYRKKDVLMNMSR